MKTLILLLLTFSCAHTRSETPSWVEGIRSGEERLRVTSGNTTLYRRIAETCENATTLAEADIEREYQKLVKYNLEVMFFDRSHNDCAVTVSVATGKVPAAAGEDSLTLQVRSLYRQRAELATKNAFTGMDYETFRMLTKDKAPIVIDHKSICYDSFQLVEFTTHGTALVCWRNGIIKGYCDTKTGKCDSKNP